MELKTASLETARLLRKHRFNEPTTSYYDTDGVLRTVETPEATCWNSPIYDKGPRRKVYAAPPLPLAQQWLREKKRFDVLVDRDYLFGRVGKYFAKVIRLRDGAISEGGHYRSYEKALEQGIVKALRTM